VSYNSKKSSGGIAYRGGVAFLTRVVERRASGAGSRSGTAPRHLFVESDRRRETWFRICGPPIRVGGVIVEAVFRSRDDSSRP
jgi:hypothetical protein